MYKLVPDRCKYELRGNYFSHRIVPIWNSLPDSVVSAESVNSFKSRLDKFWSVHDFVYDYRAVITSGRSLRDVNTVIIASGRSLRNVNTVVPRVGGVFIM